MLTNRENRSMKGIEKQEGYLSSQKVPSRLVRIIAVIGLVAVGIYILHTLSFAENISARLETFLWIALLGLVAFFIKLLTVSVDGRGKFWKEFFHGIGFASDKERRDANKNILILVVLVTVGILAVFFL